MDPEAPRGYFVVSKIPFVGVVAPLDLRGVIEIFIFEDLFIGRSGTKGPSSLSSSVYIYSSIYMTVLGF
jgi:hypothetical protein